MKNHLVRLNILLLVVGLATAIAWIVVTGFESFTAGMRRVRPAFVPLFLSVTIFYVIVRFVRWQFLLRRAGVRIPARSSLSIYIASLVGIATPAYVGEAIRSVMIKARFGIPMRVTLTTLVIERLFDVIALVIIGVLAVTSTPIRAAVFGMGVLAAMAGWLMVVLSVNFRIPSKTLEPLRRPGVFVQATLMSLVVWLPVAWLVHIAASSVGVEVPPVRGAGIYASSTLLGGLSLTPAGTITTGASAILQLTGQGLRQVDAIVVVSVYRLATTGVILLVGTILLARECRSSLRRASLDHGAAHFDEIAEQYTAQFSPHIWSLLLKRKIDLLTSKIPDPTEKRDMMGLDLGCGLGHQSIEMNKRGYRVIGVDGSHNLLRHARSNNAVVAASDAMALPFRDESFDYVFAVGLLHHLPGATEQIAACREVARVLKPGGLFLVHESNPRNPLFRFYMGYVFPILRTIDIGTEHWISEEQWRSSPGLELVDCRYFTFLPDFVPRMFLKPFLAIERALESGRLNRYAVHYLATLRKA